MNQRRILAHLTLYNSPESALIAVETLLRQEGVSCSVMITDNASANGLAEKIVARFADSVHLQRNSENIGFAAAQNQAARRCIDQEFDFLLLLNPDARLEKNALQQLVSALADNDQLAGAVPLLYRADRDLHPLTPLTIDAAGMYMTRSLRHLDRQQAASTSELVFGGSGAALLLRRSAIERLLLDTPLHNQALYRLYPQLKDGAAERAPLFDEAFFAYREDADLAWRAQILGMGFLFVPSAIGYHVRHVLPERRAALSPLINLWGVRNRFLLQLNNFSFCDLWRCVIPGIIFRNLMVIVAVIFHERSSLAGLFDVMRLLPRALARRRELFSRAGANATSLAPWFRR